MTAPASWAGVVAVICVAESTVNELASVPPKVTVLAPVNPVPVIVTVVPPAVVPEAGAIPVKVGTGTDAATVMVPEVPVMVPATVSVVVMVREPRVAVKVRVPRSPPVNV